MKTDIHPTYYTDVKIKCSCGNIIVAGSTKELLKTELCSHCHPFYTGQQKLIDTAGRVDKFQAKRKKADTLREDAKKRASAKKKVPKAYEEKVVPQEVLERAIGEADKKGKWGAPLGDTLTEEVKKEAKKVVKKTKKTVKPKIAKKTPLAGKKKSASVKKKKNLTRPDPDT